MPLTDIIRRASTYILGPEEDTLKTPEYEDNEILFCKNNICVHPPATARHDNDLHNPGYLTITTKVFIDQYNDTRRPTLFLTWIPNSSITKNTNLIGTPLKHYNKRYSLESLTSNDSNDFGIERHPVVEFKSTNPFLNYDDRDRLDMSDLSSEGSDKQGISINVDISNPEIEIIQTPDSVKDPGDYFEFSRSASVTSSDSQSNWLSTPEYLMQQHNLYFPDSVSNSPILQPKQIHKCRRFSVDLSQMRYSNMLFFWITRRFSAFFWITTSQNPPGYGQTSDNLQRCKSIKMKRENGSHGLDDTLPYRHFMVCRPEVSLLELHPEEGQVPKLTEETFRGLFNETGQLEDDLTLRKYVFFSGMDRNIRKEVWPFLLHVYPYLSTFEERIQIAEIRRHEYEEINRRRLELNENKLHQFRRKIQSVVEKDVVRTDRGNPFFAGENNPNLEIMKNILLNYAIYNSGLGYTQGMSDLLAPVLYELQDEVAAFWCFVGLMQRAVFVATPTDRDMDRNLRYLRELIRLMVPKFYNHLEKHKDALELLFCHRWILLCFKREFTEGVALRMWEACWANYLTDYFHLFLCLAIISVYADDVIAQDLRSDEMLLHFSSLAMYMDGQVIARKARGLLHQFRQMREIPCTLAGLCTRCGPGIWDSSHSPRIFCVGHEQAGMCIN
uniref:TBC1 domain family member 16 n=1 Tax=Diabrotica virgifera virgifera TaxID=50390 RepID=A0A6P7GUC7_DIAVI